MKKFQISKCNIFTTIDPTIVMIQNKICLPVDEAIDEKSEDDHNYYDTSSRNHISLITNKQTKNEGSGRLQAKSENVKLNSQPSSRWRDVVEMD